jgi:hypothetical protein
MKARGAFLCGYLVICLFSTTLHGAVQVLVHSRHVWATNDKGSTDSDMVTGSDMLPYSGTASVSWTGTNGAYTALSTHTSTITPNLVQAHGYARDWSPTIADALHQQYAETLFTETFVLTIGSQASLTGSLKGWADLGGTTFGYYDAWVVLSRQGVEIFRAGIWDLVAKNGNAGERQIDQAFSLAAGPYKLELGATAGCSYCGSPDQLEFGGGGDATYDIQLTVAPEPSIVLLLACGGLVLRTKRT